MPPHKEHRLRERDIETRYELYEDDADAPIAERMRRDRGERQGPRTRGRLTEQARARLAQERDAAAFEAGPPQGDRWSSWDGAEEVGPRPHPSWLVTDLGYLEGRRVRASREMRAMERRSHFGRNLIAQQCAVAEFAALGELWAARAPVPYPVQRIGTELLLEFIGDADGTAAPRLVQLRPGADELADLWEQLVDAMVLLARRGRTHGDLSAFNLLVHGRALVMIDLPQLVDVVANPQGRAYLQRDVRAVAGWFVARGLSNDLADPDVLVELLLGEDGLR